jgi:hypothetical protein
MTRELTTVDEIEAVVAALMKAALLTIGHDADGTETWTPTEEGIRVSRMVAMRDEGAEVLEMLLEMGGRGS